MATPIQEIQATATVSINTKTVLDSPSNANQPDSPAATGAIPIQFLTKLHSLHNIQLHQLKDGTCFLQGWKGSSIERLDFPKIETPITLHFSLQVNHFQKKVLQITAHKFKPSARENKLIVETLNEGEIRFIHAQITFFTDTAHTFIPEDGAYMDKRIASFLDLMEAGLPIEKFNFVSPKQDERIALFQALTTSAFYRPENTALEIVLTAGGMNKTQAKEAIANESVTRNTFALPTLTPASIMTLPSPAHNGSTTPFAAAAATSVAATSAAATAAAASPRPLKDDRKNIADNLVIDSEQSIEDNEGNRQIPILPNVVDAKQNTAAATGNPPAPILHSHQGIQANAQTAAEEAEANAHIAKGAAIKETLEKMGIEETYFPGSKTETITISDMDSNSNPGCCPSCVIL